MNRRHHPLRTFRRAASLLAGGVLLVACAPSAAAPAAGGEVAVRALPADAAVLGTVVVPAGLLAVGEAAVPRPRQVEADPPARTPRAGSGGAGELPGGAAVPEVGGAADAADRRATFAGGALAAALVEHNRVLMIGDSISASTSDRYSGEACAALGAAGWLVEIDAEAGRHVDFGVTVVDERLPEAEFDAAVVMLGSNYRGNPASYEADLRHIVAALAPRPTVLMTVTEFAADRVEVNAIIRDVADDYDNVRIVDWAAATAGDSGLLVGDGLHLNPAGRAHFAALIAGALGRWTGGGDTGCVPSKYTDDLS